jgi:hypothetical protein
MHFHFLGSFAGDGAGACGVVCGRGNASMDKVFSVMAYLKSTP